MRRYIVKRIGFLIVTFWAFLTILFILFRIAPGDPTSMYLMEGMTTSEREAVLEMHGLNEPLHIQYIGYMASFVTGNPGFSYRYGQPVFDILIIKFWNTIVLMGPAFILAYTFGTIFGAYIGWVRDTLREKGGLLLALVARSSPEFWTGIILLMVFTFRLGWFPSGGMRSVDVAYVEGVQRFLSLNFIWHLVLPIAAATFYLMAQPILLMRSSMIGTLNEDFIDIKKAEGLPPHKILYAHAVRNSFLPMVTVIAIVSGLTIGGSLVIETVFNWPGMGREMIDSVTSNDYPMAQGAFFLMGSVVIFMNFLADIAYVYLDPRVRYDS